MWVGALLLSLIMLPLGLEMVLDAHNTSRSLDDPVSVTVFSLLIVAILLVILCDVALATNAVISRGGGLPLPKREKTWPIWFAAIVLSVWTAWMAKFEVYALRVNGRLDVFLIWALLSLGVIVFDIALVVRAVTRSN